MIKAHEDGGSIYLSVCLPSTDCAVWNLIILALTFRNVSGLSLMRPEMAVVQ